MEEFKKKSAVDMSEKEIVFSKSIKAGKRIYYLDVKKNRKDEMFIAITESKKVVSGEADLGSMIGARLRPGMNMQGIRTAGDNLADTTSSYFSGLADQASQYDFDSLLSGSSTVPTTNSPNYSVRSDYGFGGNNTRNMTSSIFSSRPSGLLR